MVPLTIRLDEKNRILLISGPNAGGKSVCLKTVGLLQYMLQCGMLIPVEEKTVAGIFKNLFIDIGDEQSIENDLRQIEQGEGSKDKEKKLIEEFEEFTRQLKEL